MQTVPWFARALGALSVLVLVAAGCGGGSDGTSSSGPAPKGSITVGAGPVTVATAGGAATLPDATRDQIVSSVKQYLETASVTPLRTGRSAGDLAPLFTPTAFAAVNGPNRAVLVDEGTPRATGNVTATATPVAITALADPTGAIILASATLAVTVTTKTAKGPVEIKRTGELLFAPDGGTWKVAGFDVAVDRSGAGLGSEPVGSSTTGSGS